MNTDSDRSGHHGAADQRTGTSKARRRLAAALLFLPLLAGCGPAEASAFQEFALDLARAALAAWLL